MHPHHGGYLLCARHCVMLPWDLRTHTTDVDLLVGVARIRGKLGAYCMVAVNLLPWFCSLVLVIPGHKAHGSLVRWLPWFLVCRASWPFEPVSRLGTHLCSGDWPSHRFQPVASIFLPPLCLPVYCLGEAANKKSVALLVLRGCVLPWCMGSIISWTAMNLSVPVWCKAEPFEACGGWEPGTKLKSDVKDLPPKPPPKKKNTHQSRSEALEISPTQGFVFVPEGEQPHGPQIHLPSPLFSCHQLKSKTSVETVLSKWTKGYCGWEGALGIFRPDSLVS